MLTKTNALFIASTLWLSGCNTVPPAQAEDYLAPPTAEVVTHKLNFDVHTGLNAVLTLSETHIRVRVNQGQSIRLKRLNRSLMREWNERYLQLRDYDGDGMTDIGILRNTGRGGKNLCYAVYRYHPHKGHFRKRKSFDRCYG